MISTIYLDMDGVLTDFEPHYHKIIGINPKGITPEEWDENWKIWVDGKHFETLPMMEGAKELLSFVAATGIKTEILSSTGGSDFYEEIIRQKSLWLKEKGIPYHANFCPGKKFKDQYATPHRLLIDDQQSIITKFKFAGGHGITHTGNVDQTIAELHFILNDVGYKKYEEA